MKKIYKFIVFKTFQNNIFNLIKKMWVLPVKWFPVSPKLNKTVPWWRINHEAVTFEELIFKTTVAN